MEKRSGHMFLIVPYSAELRFGRVPWVVIGSKLLCLAIHHFQDDRRGALSRVFTHHCEDVYDAQLDDSSSVPSVGDSVLCAQALYLLHELQDPNAFNGRIQRLANQSDTAYTHVELNALVIWVRQQYEDIRKYVPPSMDARLVYDPPHRGLVRSLLSALYRC